MRVISNKALADFSADHADFEIPLQVWRRLMEAGRFSNFAELRRVFNAVDRVGDYYVFDICGNNCRLIVAIHFNRQMVFIRHVFTQKVYDSWKR
jgi:mRNA interferase HigB